MHPSDTKNCNVVEENWITQGEEFKMNDLKMDELSADSEIPVQEMLARFSTCSNEQLEEDFHFYKSAAHAIVGEDDSRASVDVARNCVTMARCALTVAFARVLAWAVTESHPTPATA
jgi:uncharacterized protein YacL (UPF0231 family)